LAVEASRTKVPPVPPTARVALVGLLAVLATSRAAHAEGDFDWHLPERVAASMR
jgi:hypothetical protein